MSEEITDGAAFWDARYRESERIWSGAPNAELVREAEGLPPGRALDLGCGEGDDAIWLAAHGWRVTGVDISAVALERAARHAADAGVADRVDWQRHDLARSFPAGEFDLVSAQFLHSYLAMPREDILRTAAAALAPGGVLLVTGHSGPPHWQPAEEGHHDHPAIELPTPAEVLDALRLPEDAWQILRAEEHDRLQTAPDGTPGHRRDNTVKLRRR
ncbi:class I SAM-dependent methyltransferase [Streptantibioticus silvisoli]|uniref:Class I SAM-dependent methyltransferase n=1 Tax=Streptantibioticus silvisoli TaxID=2705255 RepID=A0ABT6W777_9ACTN|nr:class I SAM-dependent methyltransferase [Streptantibioticus silvisoli]MDI5966593.1 class I SAM-dependent methyltransferase [Streptantibioticus silvisoli]